jgi:hypothetical protein
MVPDSNFPYKYKFPTYLNLSITGILNGPSGFLSGKGSEFI